MSVIPMFSGAPDLPPDLQRSVDEAVAACERVRDYEDTAFALVALWLLHIRVAAVLMDPYLRMGIGSLREEGRLMKRQERGAH